MSALLDKSAWYFDSLIPDLANMRSVFEALVLECFTQVKRTQFTDKEKVVFNLSIMGNLELEVLTALR